MTKLVLNSDQIPELKHVLPGQQIRLDLRCSIDSVAQTESGYWHVVLDVEKGTVLDKDGYDFLDVTPSGKEEGHAS